MLVHPAYILPVNVRQTAATVAPVTVWAMRGNVNAWIRKIHLVPYFDQASAAVQIHYELKRFSAATPTGGTALTVIEACNLLPASTLADARFLDTGLTTAGVVFESAFASIRGSGSQGVGAYVYEYDEGHFNLQSTEGLCIQLAATATIGQGIAGFVLWQEGV